MNSLPYTCVRDPISLLTINGGSSSIKFAVFHNGETLDRTWYGKIDRIGLSNATLEIANSKTLEQERRTLAKLDYASATECLMDCLDKHVQLQSLAAIGHRLVHGLQHTEPQFITPGVLVDLRRMVPCDPQHLPVELELIRAFATRVPSIPQFACFDTGFHVTMPRVARLLAIPRRFDNQGIQRYGFHGLSYAYLIEELVRLGDSAALSGQVILAHLGNGASLCAVQHGKSIETSMGFTPAAGLPMSTRSGDLDPGLVGYLTRTGQMSVAEFDHMINHESGLLGVSERSSDMRELMDSQATDIRSAEAIELFCYQVKKWTGAMFAVLGGLQTLVFAGGIGENAPCVRQRICQGLGCLGIKLDADCNARNAPVISTSDSPVTVRVIRTDEELTIARAVIQLMGTYID